MSATEAAESAGRPGPDGDGGARARRPGPLSSRARTSLILILVGWVVGLGRLDDNSFLTHLKTGHWILDHGIPRADVYSYTHPGTDWIAQSWLVEVVYAGVDASVGPGGIRVFDGLVCALVAWLSFRLADRVSGGGPVLPVLLPALFTTSMFWVERPLLLGILTFLALIWIVEVPDSPAGRHALIVLPALMWVWANSHGSFALGFGYLFLHLLGRWADGHRPWKDRERRLLQAAALSALVCLLNPYGPALVLFPLELLGRGDVLQHVNEWKSPSFRTSQGLAFGLWIAVFVGVLGLARSRPPRRDVLVALVFLLLGLWAVRNVAVAPLVGLPIAVRMLSGSRRELGPRLGFTAVTAVVVLALSLTQTSLAKPAYDFEDYPVAAMRFVEKEGLLGRRLLTPHAWSAYVIHEYWPRQRVFMDDRYDMYPTSFAAQYMKLRRAEAPWRTSLERHRVDVVVWDTGGAVTESLRVDPGWRVVYRDRQATVLVKR